MRIAGVYSFNGGKRRISRRYPELLTEVNAVIKAVRADVCKTKTSKEKTMTGRMLYSPRAINAAFNAEFAKIGGWAPIRVPCTYPTTYYLEDYDVRTKNRGVFS